MCLSIALLAHVICPSLFLYLFSFKYVFLCLSMCPYLSRSLSIFLSISCGFYVSVSPNLSVQFISMSLSVFFQLFLLSVFLSFTIYVCLFRTLILSLVTHTNTLLQIKHTRHASVKRPQVTKKRGSQKRIKKISS